MLHLKRLTFALMILKHLLKTEGSFSEDTFEATAKEFKSARVLLKQYVCM